MVIGFLYQKNPKIYNPTVFFFLNQLIEKKVKAREISFIPPPPYKKGGFIGLQSQYPLSVIAGGGMLMSMSFVPFSIASAKKNVEEV